jgi:hypothetical protein
MFSEPGPEDIDRLAKQWLIADSYVQEHCGGAHLQQTEDDLPLLQRVIDSKAIAISQTFELQCLGVAFGRVLAFNVEGLDWAIVDDEYGRDPTLRYRHSSLQLNVLTMISKRVEQGERVDLQEMYSGLRERLSELKNEAD